MTRRKRNFARSLIKSSRHPERSCSCRRLRRQEVRILPLRTAAATTSAHHLEQFFRLRVLVFGTAIELQIVETAIVAGFGQQLGVGADFLYATAVHHHDLI